MGLRDLTARWRTTTAELDRERLDGRFCDGGATRIGELGATVALRHPVRVSGEVRALQVVPRAGSPSLEVTIDDGSGRLVAVFTGRRHIGGLEPGRAVVVSGVAGEVGGRLQVLNPAYTLLP